MPVLLAVITGLFFFSSCSDSSTGTEEPVSEIETQLVEDLFAPSDRSVPGSKYVLFSLRTGQTVDLADSASTNWDIGFKGTSIIVNSGTSGPGSAGALMVDVAFDEVTMAPETGYKIDTEDVSAIDGWYNYTGNGNPPHAVIIAENKTAVLKTADDNHYAKLEFISYYEGQPDTSTEEFASFETRPESGHFTFRYAIQLEEKLRDLD